MPRISIVTDSDASLPNEIARTLNIWLVPISIHFGEEVFESGVTIDEAALFERIDREGILSTTAAPTPGKFTQVFRQAFEHDRSESLICLCVSGEISATYNSAKLAAGEMPEKEIRVIDTRSLSLGQGYMAMAAAQAVKNGSELDAAVRAAEDIGGRTFLFGALSTLKYLSMSGRVSQLAAGMAGMLDIKPILSVQNGKLEMIEKIRTRRRSWDRLIELARSSAGNRGIEKAAVVHVNAPKEAQEFRDMLLAGIDNCPRDVLVAQLTPGLSVHTGAGMVAVSLVVAQ
jgi:DegV family protein with EDD domain